MADVDMIMLARAEEDPLDFDGSARELAMRNECCIKTGETIGFPG